MTSMPTVWMVDPDGKIRGQIHYQRVQAVGRYCDVGTWRVTCQLTETHLNAANAGWRIIIDDPSGMYGGHLREADLAVEERDGRIVQQLVLSGEDDMAWLRDSLAWPVPTAVIGSQSTAYDVRTGVASTVMRAYLAANRGPSATATARRLTWLTLATDPVLGGSVVGRARFTPILELFQGLAITGEVGFRMVPSIGAGVTFEVYEPPELEGTARFGLSLGNLRQVRWRLTAPTATYVIGGGRGEETSRAFVAATNSLEDTDWARREAFFDYRSASSSDSGAELSEGTTRRLAESASAQLVEIQPIDTARLRYGRDYTLGSTVTVQVVDWLQVAAVIREVELAVSRGTSGPVRTVTPRVGDIGVTASPRSVRDTRDLLTRVSRLERR